MTSAAPPPDTATRIRYLVIAVIFVVSTLNYADRAALSITGSAMRQQIGFSAITLGYVFSSFAWAYMLAQLPSGWLLDRFGSRRVYAWAIFAWSLTTLLHAFADGLGLAWTVIALFVLRIATGLAEAPAFPGNSRLVAAWFPNKERGTAAAIFNASQYAATVVFAPLLGWITHAAGWRYAFIFMGVLGFVLTGIWLLVIETPTRHPRVNAGELALLRSGGALVDLDTAAAQAASQRLPTREALRQLLTSRMMIGLYAGQYCITVLTYFFLTWFPVYLITALHMNILQAGFTAAVPAICGFAGGVLGGVFSDALLRRGWSLTVARKTPIVLGMLLAASLAACPLVNSTGAVVVLMSLAFFGKGIGALGWAVGSDTTPQDAAGLGSGLLNTFANFAGVTTPIVIGYVLEWTGSFDLALVFVAVNAFLAIACFTVVMPRIERFHLRPMTSRATAAIPGPPVRGARL